MPNISFLRRPVAVAAVLACTAALCLGAFGLMFWLGAWQTPTPPAEPTPLVQAMHDLPPVSDAHLAVTTALRNDAEDRLALLPP